MDVKDCLTATDVRIVQDHSAVESAGTQKSWIEHIWPVGGGEDYHVRVRVEPVHLNQDLVQGLLTLIVAATKSSTALAPYCIDFIHEHNAGGITLRLVKEVTDPARTNTDKHLNELGPRD